MTFKYTGDKTDGWQCESECGAQMIIDNDADLDEIDFKTKIIWWAEPKTYADEIRHVDLHDFQVNGVPMLARLSAADQKRMAEWCRKVTDHQFQERHVEETHLNRRP